MRNIYEIYNTYTSMRHFEQNKAPINSKKIWNLLSAYISLGYNM